MPSTSTAMSSATLAAMAALTIEPSESKVAEMPSSYIIGFRTKFLLNCSNFETFAAKNFGLYVNFDTILVDMCPKIQENFRPTTITAIKPMTPIAHRMVNHSSINLRCRNLVTL